MHLVASAPAHLPARATWRALVSLLIATILASLAATGPQAAAPVDAATLVSAGYRDFQYGDPAAPGGDDVTAARLQSKLWFHDGRWFGVLFDNRTTPNAKFRIWRFDMATQNWTSTGIAVDDRNRSHADVLAVGNTLYVVSARAESAGTTGRDLRIYRYGYNSTSKTYNLSSGFPKLIAGTAAGTGYATIAQETGRLWVAFTQGGKVRVSASTDNAVNWSAPIDLPTLGNPVASDDVAVVAGMGGGAGVGVMWSNQNLTDDAFYFSAHVATDPAGTWQARETAPLANPGTQTYTADNHISLKTDADGNLLAAVKTGRNDDPSPNASDPLIAVFKRTGAPSAVGSWETHTVTTVAVEGTRPILVIDDAADQANVYLTFPDLFAEGQQKIYRRTAPLASLNFGTASLGTAVIDSDDPDELGINDATSTKQLTTAASGMLVLAADVTTKTYFHACIGGPCPTAPVADFTGSPTSGTAPLAVTFTDTSTNTPTAWSWDFGDGTNSTAQNPSHQYADPGTYTVTLTASNIAGSSQKTRASYIDVGVPPENYYFTMDAARVLDTRADVGLTDAFQANVPRTLSVAGSFGIPADAVAITGNLTVVGQSTRGYLSVTLAPTASPTTSTLNFPSGDNRANGVTVPLDGSGDLSIVFKAPAGNSTHVILDVTGYFRESTSGSSYFPTDPTRVLDTRTDTGLTNAFQANVPRTLSVAGSLGIPADAVAITGNLTVTGQSTRGYLSVTLAPAVNPTTSTLNFPSGDNRANGITVPLDGSGDLSIVYKAPSGNTTDVILDVTGYFRDGTSGASFVPVTPERILDTRSGLGLTGTFASGSPRTFDVIGVGGVASDADAIVGNVTVVAQTKAGYLSVTPTPVASPSTSTLNFPVGDNRANNFTVKVSGTGTDSATYKGSGGGTTHVLVDITGYYH